MQIVTQKSLSAAICADETFVPVPHGASQSFLARVISPKYLPSEPAEECSPLT